jgi:hypothetical protein
VRFVFYDTWAYRALANRRDPDHDRARVLHDRLPREGAVPLTTNYVLDETLTGIRADAGAEVAAELGKGIYGAILAGLVRYERIDPEREAEAFRSFTLYRDLPRLSFTDCTSFAVMRALHIREVFTGDAHFERADLGFRLLPA